MEWKLNSQEWDILFDLPHVDRIIYMMGIRPYMDYATGTVGIKRRISYQSLIEILEVPEENGRAIQKFTKRQIQRSIERLEKSGLITRIENNFVKIKCNLASTDESVSKSLVRGRYGSRYEGRYNEKEEKNALNQDDYVNSIDEVGIEVGTPKPQRSVTPPVSGNINNNINTCMSSSPSVDVNVDDHVDDTVVNIFDYWKSKLSHPRAVLDKKRKQCIVKAIGLGYSENDIRDAIDGCSTSPFHMGKNAQKTKYDDLTLILRDASKIETFIEFKTNPPREQNGVTKNGSSRHDWYYEKQLETIREAKRQAGFG